MRKRDAGSRPRSFGKSSGFGELADSLESRETEEEKACLPQVVPGQEGAAYRKYPNTSSTTCAEPEDRSAQASTSPATPSATTALPVLIFPALKLTTLVPGRGAPEG